MRSDLLQNVSRLVVKLGTGVLTNQFNPAYEQFFKTAQARQPADIFVFLDEHADTLNDLQYQRRELPAKRDAAQMVPDDANISRSRR